MTTRVSAGLKQSGRGVGVPGLRSQERRSDGKKRHCVGRRDGFEMVLEEPKSLDSPSTKQAGTKSLLTVVQFVS